MKEGPSIPHRFEVPANSVARERLHGIQEVVRELQAEHPEIISYAAFGSMVKGYADQESDSDGRLFVNADTCIPSNIDTKVKIGWCSIDGTPASGQQCKLWITFVPNIKAHYEGLLKAAIAQKIPDFTGEKVEHIQALPMSSEILDTAVGIWIKNEKFKKAQEEILAERPSISLPNMQKLLRRQGIEMEDKAIFVSEELSQMFFLDIGNSGLRPYRKHLVDMLVAEGEIGERIWNKIIGYTQIMERASLENKLSEISEEDKEKSKLTDVYYPRTLAEAIKVYHLE